MLLNIDISRWPSWWQIRGEVTSMLYDLYVYRCKLSRTKCADIFRIRSRMLKVKGNYKTGQQTYKCRWCKDEEETQEHILSECSAFKDLTKGIDYRTYFTNNINMLRKIAPAIRKIRERINDKDITETNNTHK